MSLTPRLTGENAKHFVRVESTVRLGRAVEGDRTRTPYASPLPKLGT